MNKYKILKEEIISSLNNKKHTLVDVTVQLPSDKQVVWQYVTVNNVVSIAAITSNQQIYVVRQWRPARKDFVYELPAGGIETKNPSETDIVDNANRELQEEIGIKAKNLKIVAHFTPTIHMQGEYYAVLATELTPSKLKADDDENVEIMLLDFDTAWHLLIESQTPSAITLINLLKAKEFLLHNST